MKIIVGLGNIGAQYEKTRHNVGFAFIGKLAQKIEKESGQTIDPQEKHKSIIGKGTFQGQQVLIAKPTTLMNLSGLAVFKLLSYYKAEASDLIVIYDDIDLPVGKIRVRKEGSAGTHNGMKSIIQELGTNQFTRIRIGIEGRGTTSPQQQDLASYVLSRFSDEEEVLVDEALKEAMGELEKAI